VQRGAVHALHRGACVFGLNNRVYTMTHRNESDRIANDMASTISDRRNARARPLELGRIRQTIRRRTFPIQNLPLGRFPRRWRPGLEHRRRDRRPGAAAASCGADPCRASSAT
jgi:hypothetical protein